MVNFIERRQNAGGDRGLGLFQSRKVCHSACFTGGRHVSLSWNDLVHDRAEPVLYRRVERRRGSRHRSDF